MRNNCNVLLISTPTIIKGNSSTGTALLNIGSYGGQGANGRDTWLYRVYRQLYIQL